MPVSEQMEFFVDPSRCIGCNACVQACSECDTHKGYSMIQLDYIFQFGAQTITTKVNMMVPKHEAIELVDVTAVGTEKAIEPATIDDLLLAAMDVGETV